MITGFTAICLIAFGVILGLIANELKHRQDKPQAPDVDEHSNYWMTDQAQDLPAFLRRQAD